MEPITLDNILKNLGNSKKHNSFIDDSFENSNIETLFLSNDNLPSCFTWLTELGFCSEP
ncbi:hypothetical protein C823_006723 [Eubacterium plexicaudatum ASF492]|uniref:Uncharacterized protein n=1 Tax=Eubacterium plexicaudatum ASF492 TaxID=1235802 RepID=N2ADG0_9FIRM|nr:hypothetical protein C823_006723 [Eubacterium plexicaudatum ASF492]